MAASFSDGMAYYAEPAALSGTATRSDRRVGG